MHLAFKIKHFFFHSTPHVDSDPVLSEWKVPQPNKPHDQLQN